MVLLCVSVVCFMQAIMHSVSLYMKVMDVRLKGASLIIILQHISLTHTYTYTHTTK